MNAVLKLALPVLPQLVSLITPVLRDSLEGLIKELLAKARTTDNPLDDILVGLLAGLLEMDPES